jgi:hypothetical protein
METQDSQPYIYIFKIISTPSCEGWWWSSSRGRQVETAAKPWCLLLSAQQDKRITAEALVDRDTRRNRLIESKNMKKDEETLRQDFLYQDSFLESTPYRAYSQVYSLFFNSNSQQYLSLPVKFRAES